MNYADSAGISSVPQATAPSISSALSRLDMVISFLTGHSEQSGAYADILVGPRPPQGNPAVGARGPVEDSTVSQLHARLDHIMGLCDTTAGNLSRIGSAIGGRN